MHQHLLVVEVHGVFVDHQVTLGNLDQREFTDSWGVPSEVLDSLETIVLLWTLQNVLEV